jgi:peptidoglycan hydrolase-like protein with peptidoglycan-binding domain
MRRLILTTASVIALGAGLTLAGSAPANAWTHQSAMHGRMTHLSRAEISDIQQKLQADNLYSGKIDGKMGPETRRALAEFQKQNGLRVTANLDRQTRDSLLGTMGTGASPTSETRMTAPMQGGGNMPPAGQGATNMPPSSNMGGTTHPAPTGGATPTGR